MRELAQHIRDAAIVGTASLAILVGTSSNATAESVSRWDEDTDYGISKSDTTSIGTSKSSTRKSDYLRRKIKVVYPHRGIPRIIYDYLWEGNHSGIDIRLSTGTEVIAAASGWAVATQTYRGGMRFRFSIPLNFIKK